MCIYIYICIHVRSLFCVYIGSMFQHRGVTPCSRNAFRPAVGHHKPWLDTAASQIYELSGSTGTPQAHFENPTKGCLKIGDHYFELGVFAQKKTDPKVSTRKLPSGQQIMGPSFYHANIRSSSCMCRMQATRSHGPKLAGDVDICTTTVQSLSFQSFARLATLLNDQLVHRKRPLQGKAVYKKGRKRPRRTQRN